MKHKAGVVLLVAALSLGGGARLHGQTAERLGPSSIFFSSVALQGFSVPGLTDEGEYVNLGVGIDPFQTDGASCAFGLHWLFPFNPFDIAASRIGFSVDLTIGRFFRHPLGALFVRKVSLAPMIGLAGYVQPASPGSPMLLVSCQPLRFFSGDGYYSAAAVDIAFDANLQYRGWGLRLFDFTYFIH